MVSQMLPLCRYTETEYVTIDFILTCTIKYYMYFTRQTKTDIETNTKYDKNMVNIKRKKNVKRF